jgi:hypothetical protein
VAGHQTPLDLGLLGQELFSDCTHIPELISESLIEFLFLCPHSRVLAADPHKFFPFTNESFFGGGIARDDFRWFPCPKECISTDPLRFFFLDTIL